MEPSSVTHSLLNLPPGFWHEAGSFIKTALVIIAAGIVGILLAIGVQTWFELKKAGEKPGKVRKPIDG